MAMIARKALVYGKVQGVFYRASTRQFAISQGVSGKATNLPDGRVEVHLYGDENQVQKVIDWLHQGPEHAAVTQVLVEDLPWQDVNGFTTE